MSKRHYMALFSLHIYISLFPGSNFSFLAFPEIDSCEEKCTHLTWSLPEQKNTGIAPRRWLFPDRFFVPLSKGLSVCKDLLVIKLMDDHVGL